MGKLEKGWVSVKNCLETLASIYSFFKRMYSCESLEVQFIYHAQQQQFYMILLPPTNVGQTIVYPSSDKDKNSKI